MKRWSEINPALRMFLVAIIGSALAFIVERYFSGATTIINTIIYGSFGGILTEYIFLGVIHREASNQHNEGSNQHYSDSKLLYDALHIPSISCLRVIMSNGYLGILGKDMKNTWAKLLRNTYKRYRATSIVLPENWKNSYHHESHSIFSELHNKRVKLTRIILIDSVDDLANYEKEGIIRKDLDSHIVVKYLAKSDAIDIMERELHQRGGVKIESLDFGIFDDDVVFVWHIESNGQLEGDLYFKTEAIQAYSALFELLNSKATKVSNRHNSARSHFHRTTPSAKG